MSNKRVNIVVSIVNTSTHFTYHIKHCLVIQKTQYIQQNDEYHFDINFSSPSSPKVILPLSKFDTYIHILYIIIHLQYDNIF